MKIKHSIASFILAFYLGIFATIPDGNTQVEPPNYNFSIDSLLVLKPGSDLAMIESKLGKGVVVDNGGTRQTIKFYVSQLRYKFPVLVQVFQGKVTDFYARLPSYFLHDVFHQSLINRFGKQDSYQKIEETAVYTWKNKEGAKVIYYGICTITCFPMAMTMVTLSPPNDLSNFKSILENLKIE